MTCEEKIWELRQIIEEQLTPLINNDYVLYYRITLILVIC